MAKRQTVIAITLPSAEDARQLLQDLRAFDADTSEIHILDAVFASKDGSGAVHIRQTGDLDGAQGAFGGGVIGLIAGAMMLGPVGAALGTTLGGLLAGLYTSLRDSGMNNSMMRNIVRDLQPGQTTLILLYEGSMHPAMHYIFRRHSANLFYTNLPVGAEDTLRAILGTPAYAETLHELRQLSVNEADLNAAHERHTPVYVVDEDDVETRPSRTDEPPAPGLTTLAMTTPMMPSGVVAPAVVPLVAEMAVTSAAAPQSENAVVRLKSDDLTRIYGITPDIEQLLRDKGIKTYVQLSETSTSDIRNILNRADIPYPPALATWTEQAWLAQHGYWDELAELQLKLRTAE
jgi:uncharacterized membrane protein/predicted flap endonuclease-1-like 5' DNA nuclease